mmetsp:Transcript_33319/g.48260  ORF Transcript_33319/g.48260 Transcript_33319/m.48260 type:complete len:276 (-) Transcript_33319:682-1509(-)
MLETSESLSKPVTINHFHQSSEGGMRSWKSNRMGKMSDLIARAEDEDEEDEDGKLSSLTCRRSSHSSSSEPADGPGSWVSLTGMVSKAVFCRCLSTHCSLPSPASASCGSCESSSSASRSSSSSKAAIARRRPSVGRGAADSRNDPALWRSLSAHTSPSSPPSSSLRTGSSSSWASLSRGLVSLSCRCDTLPLSSGAASGRRSRCICSGSSNTAEQSLSHHFPRWILSDESPSNGKLLGCSRMFMRPSSRSRRQRTVRLVRRTIGTGSREAAVGR